jgi:excinuclease ABC subunit B
MNAVRLDVAAESLSFYGAEETTGQIIKRLEAEMKAAAKELKFEQAAVLRNRIRALKLKDLELKPEV